MSHWKSLVGFLVLVAIAAAAGSLSAPDAWFEALHKPSFNPPNWIFAPVWSVLYVLIAIAAWRVYRHSGLTTAIGLWGAQLLANAIWSPLFFGMHRIDLALIDIILLDMLVLATIAMFFARERLAAWLMAPYLAWIAFATALNGAIWSLNPG